MKIKYCSYRIRCKKRDITLIQWLTADFLNILYPTQQWRHCVTSRTIWSQSGRSRDLCQIGNSIFSGFRVELYQQFFVVTCLSFRNIHCAKWYKEFQYGKKFVSFRENVKMGAPKLSLFLPFTLWLPLKKFLTDRRCHGASIFLIDNFMFTYIASIHYIKTAYS